MSTVVFAMVMIMGVGGVVLGVVAWLHHLAGSVESQARVRRWRFQWLWHAYRARLRVASWSRMWRRRLAAAMSGLVEPADHRQERPDGVGAAGNPVEAAVSGHAQ